MTKPLTSYSERTKTVPIPQPTDQLHAVANCHLHSLLDLVRVILSLRSTSRRLNRFAGLAVLQHNFGLKGVVVKEVHELCAVLVLLGQHPVVLLLVATPGRLIGRSRRCPESVFPSPIYRGLALLEDLGILRREASHPLGARDMFQSARADQLGGHLGTCVLNSVGPGFGSLFLKILRAGKHKTFSHPPLLGTLRHLTLPLRHLLHQTVRCSGRD